MLELLDIPRDPVADQQSGEGRAAGGEGVTVVERLPLALPANPHNERYLATKRDRTGHQL